MIPSQLGLSFSCFNVECGKERKDRVSCLEERLLIVRAEMPSSLTVAGAASRQTDAEPLAPLVVKNTTISTSAYQRRRHTLITNGDNATAPQVTPSRALYWYNSAELIRLLGD